MMKRALLVLGCLLLATTLHAQTAGTTSALGWDQVAPSAATAQSYTYRTRADGSTTGVVLPGVTCTGAVSPYQCKAPFPAFTPGAHTLTLTASNAAGESAPSPVLSFTFVVIPAVPGQPRIEPAAAN